MYTAAIRDAGATCAEHTHIPQQLHRECMWEMEREAIEEEGRDCQSFLTACGVALQACSPEAHSILMYPQQLLMENMSLAALLAISPSCPLQWGNLLLQLPSNCVGETHTQTAMLFIWGEGYWTSFSYQRTYSSEVKRGEVPCRAQRKSPGDLLLGHWSSPGHQADIFWDTLPYFWPWGIPWSLQSILGDDHICQPPGVVDLQNPSGLDWTGRPQVSPSCIEEFAQVFFCLVSPVESLKVMGLKGIHHPDALCCHAGLSYCPWCGKEGQNEGTMVNHLQTTHYKIGLVCSRCLQFPSITSKAIWHHDQACKHSDAKEEDRRPSDDDSSSLDWFTPSHPLPLLWLLYQSYI